MKKYGLIFRIKNEIYLAEYKKGEIEDGSLISDYAEIYKDLPENKVSLVEIISSQQDVVYLKDLKIFKIENKENPNATILDMLKEGRGHEFANKIYAMELKDENMR